MNSLTFTKVSSNPAEFPAKTPTVWHNGKQKQYLYCMKIEENSGVMPSKATLRFMPELLQGWQLTDSLGDGESTSPNTLSKLEAFLPDFGDRIAVMVDEQVLFAGHIMRRNDSCQNDTLLFTALDDREMLAKIPVRGAIVRDEFEDAEENYLINFLSRYNAVANPNGLWNCIGTTLDLTGHPLDGQVVPVFASKAYLRQNYESPDEVFSDELTEGIIAPWTPRRMLQYFWLILHLGCDVDSEGNLVPDIKGINRQTWRSLRNYPKNIGLDTDGSFPPNHDDWAWDYTTLNFVGLEPRALETDGPVDPLDRKLPTIDFQGKAVLQAIDEVMQAAGTHTYKIVAEPISEVNADTGKPELTGIFRSTFDFFPIGITAISYSENKRKIPLMRGGKPSNLPDCDTAYDFQLQEDITFQRPSVLVEGEVVKVETSLRNDISDGGLVSAWSVAEELAFKQIIWGSDDANDTDYKDRYAKYPTTQSVDNDTIQPFSQWRTANNAEVDGVRSQLARACSPEALQLARSIFPRVFRAFSIGQPDGYQNVRDALDGSGDEYADTDIYPQANILRQALAQQLQFQISDLNSGGDTENWLEEKFPVRIEIKNYPDTSEPIDYNEGWENATYTNIQSIGNGEFLVDMAEQFNTKPQCIYKGSLYASGAGSPCAPLAVELKDIRMNVAFPMDHRVSGYVSSKQNTIVDETNKDRLYINTKYMQGTGDDGAMLYVDSPNAYKEEHQVNSTPTPHTELMAGGDATITAPLIRLLPPGSEAENAE